MTLKEKFYNAYNKTLHDFRKWEQEGTKCSICGSVAQVLQGDLIGFDGFEFKSPEDLCENCLDNLYENVED